MKSMIMKAVNELLKKDNTNEALIQTNNMSLTAPEMAIINKHIIRKGNKKVNLSKIHLWN